MVVDGQERVDQRLLASLLVVPPCQLRFEGDPAEEGQGEEDPDDPPVDDERRDGIEGGVGRHHHPSVRVHTDRMTWPRGEPFVSSMTVLPPRVCRPHWGMGQ